MIDGLVLRRMGRGVGGCCWGKDVVRVCMSFGVNGVLGLGLRETKDGWMNEDLVTCQSSCWLRILLFSVFQNKHHKGIPPASTSVPLSACTVKYIVMPLPDCHAPTPPPSVPSPTQPNPCHRQTRQTRPPPTPPARTDASSSAGHADSSTASPSPPCA